MKLNRKRSQTYLQTFDFESLFIEELGWDTVDPIALPLTTETEIVTAEAIAQKRGFMVYQCELAKIPPRKVRLQLDQQLTEYSRSHLLIFRDTAAQQQVWMWVKPEGKKRKPIFHTYKANKSAEALIQKLEPLLFSLDEEDAATLVTAINKVSKGFNIEQVTKQFFQDFEGLHQVFCLEIEGIDQESDRSWYASVLLNRLMFIYFLQRRYFLDQQDAEYLQHKLQFCQSEQTPFYGFLQDLFFEGFAKPERDRAPEIQQRLGQIVYLNGGLFLRHPIEQQYPEITIRDRAFEQVFALFERYSWHLDDRPDAEKDSNEINPDVLGYIFEKYINQKEFGAYYTRPEITEYLCDRTVNKLVVDRVNQQGQTAFTDLPSLLSALTPDLAQLLLETILPQLTLLDPACGSGAFLVAAMKSLIPIYHGAIAASAPDQFTQFYQGSASLDYYVKKCIITDNLYGVDIMAEATEIAQLRLFLALVAAAERVEDLEPLPNVDFNIMAGNSLIGLIRVDGDAFNQVGQSSGPVQGELFNAARASEYERILKEKNKSIALYKKHAFQRFDADTPQENRLINLRTHIDQLNGSSQVKLNQLLLEEFSGTLKIKFEAAQLSGKAKKRLLTVEDIERLTPFHWGYHFDKVFARGGFDAIIANPPWEVFKPNAKEFFETFSDLVKKKKMDIKSFKKVKKKLLEDPEIAEAWLEYQSQFPYVSRYYRSAEDYHNQVSIVNGRKQGTDINLYKLFLERCFHLLQSSGRCGIIIPSGVYTDLGSKQLREMLFSKTQVDTLFGLSNEKFIFEGVHHAFKFALISFEKGQSTKSFNAVFRINPREAIRSSELSEFFNDKEKQLDLSVDLVRRLSPDSLSIMEFKEPIDIAIANKMTQFPLLGEQIANTWNLKLTAEFHMTSDSHLFKTEPAPGRLPLYEGKMIHQFTHLWGKPKYWLDEDEAREVLFFKRCKAIKKELKKHNLDITFKDKPLLNYNSYRIAFRDVAASTNERTVIATVLPPKVYCPHTMSLESVYSLEVEDQESVNLNFSSLSNKERLFLCAMMNSFVVDAWLRRSVTAHVSFFFVYNTPIPRLQEGDKGFAEIVDRAAKLICTTPEFDDLAAAVGLGSHANGVTDPTERNKLRAELDGMIAHLYGLTAPEFEHILSTFPIVPDETKQAARSAYRQNPI